MLPICMVNEETLAQVPEDVLLYLRALRRRIIELEQTDPQQRIAQLEAANRGLQVQLDDAQAKLTPNPSTPPLPPPSDRFHRKRRPPPAPGQPARKRGGQVGHPR